MNRLKHLEKEVKEKAKDLALPNNGFHIEGGK